MMALSGVRTSWLIRASTSALALAARSACRRACSSSVSFLRDLRQIAEHREEIRAVGPGPSHRHRQRNEAAAAHPAQHLAAVVEQAGDAGALDAFEIVPHHALAFRREQVGQIALRQVVAVIAEQRLGAAVAGIEVAFARRTSRCLRPWCRGWRRVLRRWRWPTRATAGSAGEPAAGRLARRDAPARRRRCEQISAMRGFAVP